MHKQSIFIIAGLTVATLVSCTPSAAATFGSTVSQGQVVITLDGEITDGDAERLRQLIKSASDAGYRVATIWLNSPGGKVLEGASLADIILATKTTTAVANGATCGSACFMLFMAGAKRFADYGSSIGVHSAAGEDGNENPVSEVLTLRTARIYKSLGVTSGVIEKMITTPPSGASLLAPNELTPMGVTMMGTPPTTQVPGAIVQLPPVEVPAVIAAPTNLAPTWHGVVSEALNASKSQNNGNPLVSNDCRQRGAPCSVAIFWKGADDGRQWMTWTKQDGTGHIFAHEICSFESASIRYCYDYDRKTLRKDATDENGAWVTVGNQ